MAQKYLNSSVATLIRRYREALLREGIPVERLILFGSRAKGKAKLWSDIDLCVVSKSFGKNHHDEMVKLSRLALPIEPLIEPVPYHPKDLSNTLDPLVHEIHKHGQVVI